MSLPTAMVPSEPRKPMEWPRRLGPSKSHAGQARRNRHYSDDDETDSDDEISIQSGSSESETESDVECKPTTEADVVEEDPNEPGSNHSNLPSASLSYVEKLERDNLRLTQQLRELWSRERHGQEPAASMHNESEPMEATQAHESGEEVEVQDGHSATALKRETRADDNCPSLEIVRYLKKQSRYGRTKLVNESDALGDDDVKDLSGKHVLTVIREFDDKKAFWRTCIEIFSPGLQDFFDRVPGFTAKLHPVDDVFHLTEPFLYLFLNRKVLTEAIESQDVGSEEKDLVQARPHVQVVLDYLREDFPENSRKLDDIESETPSGVINYPELYLVYKPGTIVYTFENGEYEAFVIDSVRGMNKRQKKTTKSTIITRGGRYKRQKSTTAGMSHGRLDITCWSIGYDGEIFGRVWSMHCIQPFHGTREISSLDLIPEKFLPNAAEVKQSLLGRGGIFWSLQGQQCREYTGELYSQHTSEEATRVMVDHLTYQRRKQWPISINGKRGPADALNKTWKDHRSKRLRGCADDDSDDCDFLPRSRKGRKGRRGDDLPREDTNGEDFSSEDDSPSTDIYGRWNIGCPAPPLVRKYDKYDLLESTSQPDDLTLLLCPQYVHGYCLREKVWKTLKITQLRSVTYRKNAWDRLVLDAEYKSIVQAMVGSYVSKSSSMDDLVAGKGSGLVALLHGPPGSGKTLTAECVAESFSKPLYHVTCGDIGTYANELESRLADIFDYAVTWGAILLLDEADIFLQDRDSTSLERNALVSIFLRTLEYFSGILFLTTNRVGTFDQAFQSRIHVTLGLPVLDQTRRIAVWDIFVDDLAAKNGYGDEEHERLRTLVRQKWSQERLNGRQIRNTMRTALVVAEQKGVVVGDEEVGFVLKIGREFEGYMSAFGKGLKEGIEGFEEIVPP